MAWTSAHAILSSVPSLPGMTKYRKGLQWTAKEHTKGLQRTAWDIGYCGQTVG